MGSGISLLSSLGYILYVFSLYKIAFPLYQRNTVIVHLKTLMQRSKKTLALIAFPLVDDVFAHILSYLTNENKLIMGRMQMISKEWTLFLHRNLHSFTWDLYAFEGKSTQKTLSHYVSHSRMFPKLSKLRSLHLIFDEEHTFASQNNQIKDAFMHKTTITSITITKCECNREEAIYFQSLTNLTSLTFNKTSYQPGGITILSHCVFPKLTTLIINNVKLRRCYHPLTKYPLSGKVIANNFTSLKNLELNETDLISLEEIELLKTKHSYSVLLNGVKL
jgi:hypothetical protein